MYDAHHKTVSRYLYSTADTLNALQRIYYKVFVILQVPMLKLLTCSSGTVVWEANLKLSSTLLEST